MLGNNLTPGGQPINLSSLMSAPNAMASDMLAGGVAQGLGAMSGPALRGVAGMMGLDPMSIGLRMAQGAWGSGAGVMGAGLAGGLGMVGGGIAAAGLGFAGSQIYAGAQQQQQLNLSLGQNFRFMNPLSSTGQGFSRSQMHEIGSGMRELTHSFGAGGEVVGFGELSRLADKMGQMGMAQNVKSVTDFKDKFKQMISTLKKVATELGSSLEEAQKFTGSMRQSGVFRAADQIAFAKGMRTTALAGGLAESEVTAMANIGSQISRSVGGTGRQGAMGGMKGIGQIGMALQTGALSEEDIYNATGLTGAEGRQAMASSMMQQSASFYKSGRGRRFLAEIAQPNGSVDMAAVNEIMGGGVPGPKHHAVGQANFVRNEGRLRGAALEQFGVLGQTLAYKGWLNQRSMNIDSMDDRSMLAFQRMSGMGRDQAEAALKMVQGLPEMSQLARQTKSDQGYMDDLAAHRKTSGIAGMKNKLDQMREGVQGKLQQMGADLFEGGASLIEDWFNKTTGTYERRMSEDLNQVHHALKSAVGTANKAAADKALKTTIGTGRFLGDSGMAISRASMDAKGMSTADRSAMARASTLDQMEFGASSVGETGLKGLGDGMLSGLREAYAKDKGISTFKGDFRVDAFRRELEAMAGKDPKAKELLKQLDDAGPGRQAAIVESVEVAMGREKEDRLSGSFTGQYSGDGLRNRMAMGRSTKGQYSIDMERGRELLGTRRQGIYGDLADKINTSFALSSQGMSSGTRSIVGGVLGTVADVFKGADSINQDVSELLGLSGKQERAASKFMTGAEGRKMIGGLLMGDEEAERAVQEKRSRLRGKGDKASEEEKGVLGLLDNMTVAKKLGQMVDANGGKELSEAQKAELEAFAETTTGRKMSHADIVKVANQGKNAAASVYVDNVRELTRKNQLEAGEMRKQLGSLGVLDLDTGGNVVGLNKATATHVAKTIGKAGTAVLESAQRLATATFTGDAEKDAVRLEERYGEEQKLSDNISRMSLAEKRAFAGLKGIAGTDLASRAAESAGREDRLRGREKAYTAKHKKGGVVGALAQEMGVDLSGADAEALGGQGEWDAADNLIRRLGVQDPSKDGNYRKAVAEAIAASKSGDKGRAADILSGAAANASPETQKKLKEAADAKRGDTPDANLSRIAENTKSTVTELGKVINAIGQIKGPTNPEAPVPPPGK